MVLLENLFDMVNNSVLIVVGVSMINKLRLGVAKITMSVCVCACCVCVCEGRTCPYKFVCVCVSVFSGDTRVVFAYNCYTPFNIIFCFLYPQNLLLGHVAKPFLASVTQ